MHRSTLHQWQGFVTVGNKIDSGRNRLDYCTAGYFCQQMIPFISGESAFALASFGKGFGLHHPDLSTSNIFVDDDLNITCIIDWTFTSTVPVSTSLMTPSLPHPRDDNDLTLDSAFRSSLIDDHDEGNPTKFVNADVLAEIWEYTDRAWLFTRLMTLDGDRDYYYFKELYTSVYKPQEEVNISNLFRITQKEDHLIQLAGALADDEEYIPQLLEEEELYFAVVGKTELPWTEASVDIQSKVKLIGIERRAIARKITLVSELSQNFVADKRLWSWIEEVRRDRASAEDFTHGAGSVPNRAPVS